MTTFNAYLFHIIGNMHVLLACIRFPWTNRAGQPVPWMFRSIMEAWDIDKNSSEHLARRTVSMNLTFNTVKLNTAAHSARENLRRAENSGGADEMI